MPTLTIERLATAILFLLLFAMAIRVPVDTDMWWHIRSGEYALENGKILTEDIYSFTQQGKEWINHSWGGQIILALFYRATGGNGAIDDGGVIGLALYTALLGTAGMAFVYRACAGNIYSRAFVMVIGAATAAVFWSPRPQMFSFFLSAVVVYLLYLFKVHHKNYVPWLLLPLMILWGNLHAGYAIGVILLVGFIAGEVLGNLIGTEDPHRVTMRRLVGLALAGVAGYALLIVNPYGTRLWSYPLETAQLQTLNLFIQEWLSPNFKSPQTWAFLILLLSLLGFALRGRRPVAWSDITLATGTALMAFFAARNIAVFAVVATPVLSRVVDGFLTDQGWQIKPRRRVTRWQVRLNWVLLMVVLLGVFAKVYADLSSENVQDVQAELYPLDALAYLEANPPTGNLFNDYNWGGLLIFTQPDTPVFVDGRTDLFGDDFLADYFRAILGTTDWQDALNDYDIQTALITESSALASLLRQSPDWTVAYEDDDAIILERVAEG